jgi:hypothetical protein
MVVEGKLRRTFSAAGREGEAQAEGLRVAYCVRSINSGSCGHTSTTGTHHLIHNICNQIPNGGFDGEKGASDLLEPGILTIEGYTLHFPITGPP